MAQSNLAIKLVLVSLVHPMALVPSVHPPGGNEDDDRDVDDWRARRQAKHVRKRIASVLKSKALLQLRHISNLSQAQVLGIAE